MVSITLSVSEEVRELMKSHPEINWSALVRQAIFSKAQELALKRKLLLESEKDTEINAWAVELIRKGRRK